MKSFKIESTKLTLSNIKGYRSPDSDEIAQDYTAFIEHALDLAPQGGFTSKDIRDRNRIQVALDKVKDGVVKFEDADYVNLKTLIKNARWGTRDKELQIFLDKFEK